MTNQVIPAEAVEAAAKAIREKGLHSNYYPTFDVIQAILEAAAPHMQCGCAHKPEPYGPEVALLDISKLKIGERVELNGRTGTVTMVDTVLPDLSTGLPVVLVNWDDQP